MTSDPIFLFISHASKEQRAARNIKNTLDGFRIDGFVAHEDIRGGEEWMTTLFEGIKSCAASTL